MRSPPSRQPRRRVFLNAVNVTASGATMLVRDLLPALYAAAPQVEFTTLVADDPLLLTAAASSNARVLSRGLRRGPLNDLTRLVDVHYGLSRLIKASRADVCLTLGDLGPSRLSCPHVLFLHNSNYLYGPEELNGFNAWPPLKRRYLLWQIGRSLAEASGVIVQTPVMRSRLMAQFRNPPSEVHVVPLPVPQHVAQGSDAAGRSVLASCRKPIRLLFLAAYYAHKNHGIIPRVAQEIRARGLIDTIHIFVTLGDRAPAALRKELAEYPDVVSDVGRLPPEAVSEALADASALFLPTLVESYGLVYVEAMACGRPILTSDRDFARWMCRDVAGYFDPLNESSIVDAIMNLPALVRKTNIAERCEARLRELPPDWRAVATQFARALQLPLESEPRTASADESAHARAVRS